MEVFVEELSSVASGVAPSVGCLVCKCLILSGQCRQCYLLLFLNRNYRELNMNFSLILSRHKVQSDAYFGYALQGGNDTVGQTPCANETH
jgi:hypothetical protein